MCSRLAEINSSRLAAIDSTHLAAIDSCHLAAIDSTHLAAIDSTHLATINGCHLAAIDSSHFALNTFREGVFQCNVLSGIKLCHIVWYYAGYPSKTHCTFDLVCILHYVVWYSRCALQFHIDA